MASQEAPPVDQDQARRATKRVGAHRLRHRIALRGRRQVHADRECDAVFVQECLQGYRRHCRMVLEHRVQADDRDVLRGKCRVDAARLRQTVLNTSRAEHLERVQHDDLAAQASQCHRRSAIEPLRRRPLGCRLTGRRKPVALLRRAYFR